MESAVTPSGNSGFSFARGSVWSPLPQQQTSLNHQSFKSGQAPRLAACAVRRAKPRLAQTPFGAGSARPASCQNPRGSKCCRRVLLARYSVSKSARFAAPTTLRREKQPLAQILLHQRLANRQVSHTANAAPPANADCICAVCMHFSSFTSRSRFWPCAEVDTFSESFDNGPKCELAGVESDCLLGRRPVLDEVRSTHVAPAFG